MKEKEETKIDCMFKAKMAGLSQSQIAAIINCTQANVSMILSGKRNMTFSQEMLLTRFLDNHIKKTAVTLIPMPIKDKELKRMIQFAIHEQEGDEIEFEKVNNAYNEVTQRIISKYALVNTTEEYNKLNNDYSTRLLCKRHSNIARRRLELHLSIKARAAYIIALKTYIDNNDIGENVRIIPAINENKK